LAFRTQQSFTSALAIAKMTAQICTPTPDAQNCASGADHFVAIHLPITGHGKGKKGSPQEGNILADLPNKTINLSIPPAPLSYKFCASC
jgi:hypothetical protein